MLFIHDENRAECIRLNVDIEEQRKRLFSKYASNLAFFNIQMLKESFDRHKTFVNVESLYDYCQIRFNLNLNHTCINYA